VLAVLAMSDTLSDRVRHPEREVPVHATLDIDMTCCVPAGLWASGDHLPPLRVLSRSGCSKIRNGKRIPHPRHWAGIRRAGRIASCQLARQILSLPRRSDGRV